MFTNFYETLTSNNGLRATFIVIFVATMLTVYELSMFYFVVVPKVNSQINQGIIDISDNFSVSKSRVLSRQSCMSLTPTLSSSSFSSI